MPEWWIELKARSLRTGFVIADTRAEAEEKVARGEWEAVDTNYWELGKPKITRRIRSRTDEGPPVRHE